MKRRTGRTILLWIWVAFGLYVIVSVMAYQLAHPDMTETQRFFRLLDAFAWDW